MPSQGTKRSARVADSDDESSWLGVWGHAAEPDDESLLEPSAESDDESWWLEQVCDKGAKGDKGGKGDKGDKGGKDDKGGKGSKLVFVGSRGKASKAGKGGKDGKGSKDCKGSNFKGTKDGKTGVGTVRWLGNDVVTNGPPGTVAGILDDGGPGLLVFVEKGNKAKGKGESVAIRLRP